MSDTIFDTLTPWYPFKEDIEYQVMVSRSVNGHEQRKLIGSRGTRRFGVTYGIRSKLDAQTLWNFYSARFGVYDPFYFPNRNDRIDFEYISTKGASDTYTLLQAPASGLTLYSATSVAARDGIYAQLHLDNDAWADAQGKLNTPVASATGMYTAAKKLGTHGAQSPTWTTNSVTWNGYGSINQNSYCSMSVWMTRGGSTANTIQIKNGSTVLAYISVTSAGVGTFTWGATGLVNTFSVPVGYNHIVAVHDGSNSVDGLKVYLNGVSVGVVTGTVRTFSATAATFFLSCGYSSSYIDEVQLYKAVLGLTEAQTLYNGGAGTTDTIPAARLTVDYNALVEGLDYTINKVSGLITFLRLCQHVFAAYDPCVKVRFDCQMVESEVLNAKYQIGVDLIEVAE